MSKNQVLPIKNHPRFQEIQEIFQTLENAGHDTVIAGGAVRDWLLGREPKDIDFVTSAMPEEVEKLFKKTVPVGKSFGVMMVVIHGHPFEVATFRSEGPYLDGRRPSQVQPASPQEDAQRRDFTINGLFYDLIFEEVWDFVDGLKDIEKKTLRAIGDPRARFQEDHLRVLRAYRFMAQLGFKLESSLEKALRTSTELIKTVSRERIREEILKLMSADKRPDALKLMIENKVFEALLSTEKHPVKWSFQMWQPWREPHQDRGLLELGLWYLKLGGHPQDLVTLLQLSNAQAAVLKNGLMWWQGETPFGDLSQGEMIEKFWDPDFRVGFLEFEHSWTGSSEKFKEGCRKAWKTFLEWGDSKPVAWITAKELPEVQGPALGKKLKTAWYAQLERKFSKPEELLAWVKTQ